MKFLIDEDVPVKLLKTLTASGHDAVRVKPSSPDSEIAQLAKREERILITLDKDFVNKAVYPPKEFNIVRIQIHPPEAHVVTEAFQKLLQLLPPHELKGLIVLLPEGPVRIPE